MKTSTGIWKTTLALVALVAGLVASAATAAEKAPIRQESATGIRHSLLITGSTGTYRILNT